MRIKPIKIDKKFYKLFIENNEEKQSHLFSKYDIFHDKIILTFIEGDILVKYLNPEMNGLVKLIELQPCALKYLYKLYYICSYDQTNGLVTIDYIMYDSPVNKMGILIKKDIINIFMSLGVKLVLDVGTKIPKKDRGQLSIFKIV